MREDASRVESNARELAASESRLQTMFESSLVPQLVTDAQTWEIRDANTAFVELSGHGRADLIGRRARDVALVADTASFDSVREAISARGVVGTWLQVALRRPDGPARRCLVSCREMQVGGCPIRLWSIVDITEIREAERALRASQRRFEALFQASPVAASIASVDEGRILEVNRAYETMFGRTREQTIGRTGRELGLYRDYAVREEGLARIRAEGRLQDVEAEIVTASGEVRSAIGSVVIIDWEGEPAALFQMIDVTCSAAAPSARSPTANASSSASSRSARRSSRARTGSSPRRWRRCAALSTRWSAPRSWPRSGGWSPASRTN